ncbi:MAG: ABC transporter permease [Bacteroidota bacterium]|jgi:putative ABC transport system permease protein|nr:ABC transporter permease [Cytophagales bacterium]MCE2955724.1 ABC transporter permease [Flammeovirgaceae bacterium]MCZ8070734.1 ABC transporter permease [Cytophagales bacterium]
MIKHYLTLALRNIWKKKFHSAINVFGLAVGISACLVIYLIVNFELSFNKGITDYDRIYRMHSSFTGTIAGLNRGIPTAVPPYVNENFKGIESSTHFHTYSGKVLIPTSGNNLELGEQEKLILAAPDFFEVFKPYQWLAGSPKESLSKPFQVVLTSDKAKKYFGELSFEKIIGRQVVYEDSLRVNVSGVVSPLPFNTDLEMTDFISFATIKASWLNQNFSDDDWGSTNSSSQFFVKLNEGVAPKEVSSQFPPMFKIYKDKSSCDAENKFALQPLSNIHYNAEVEIFDFSRSPAHMPTLITLAIVAALLLVTGAINFINLETAQAVRRAKEVGVRKVMGSDRNRLILQFIFESTLITLIGLLLSLPFAEVELLYFKEFIPQGIKLDVIGSLPFLGLVLFFVGILAGAYPAFVLASLKPALALKNLAHANSSQSRSAFLRKTLIVTQFAFAQVLIIGTIVVSLQIKFMLNKDLGFKKDEVIYFNAPWWEKREKVALLKNEITSLAEVKEFSMSGSPPSANGWSSSSITHKDSNGETSISSFRKSGDPNYIGFYNIELVAGRNLYESDTVKELLVNETLAKKLGFGPPDKALGEIVQYGRAKIPIVGVVKDFHVQSMHKAIEPVMMGCENKYFSCFNIRLNTSGKTGDEVKAKIAQIENSWKKIYPDAPFEYKFLDETIANFYKTEQRTAKLINTATALAILISCLGLFGLASHSTTQRTKEIGIRKVLGASVRQITLLLSKDFMLYVAIAFVVAIPIAIWGAQQWLSDFAYRVELNAWMFGATAFVAMVIAFVTISFQTVKAANSNPVDSLRSE